MTYAVGALAGVILGGLSGYLKNIFVWQRYLKKSEQKDPAEGIRPGDIYARAGISFAIDILVLAAAFLLGAIPYINRISILIATAVMLSVLSVALTIRQQRKMQDHIDKEAKDDGDA